MTGTEREIDRWSKCRWIETETSIEIGIDRYRGRDVSVERAVDRCV